MNSVPLRSYRKSIAVSLTLDLDSAEELIVRRLRSGGISAVASDIYEFNYIDKEPSKKQGGALTLNFWENATINWDRSTARMVSGRPENGARQVVAVGLEIVDEQYTSLLPQPLDEMAPLAAGAKVARGGRPPKYDWESAIIFVASRVYLFSEEIERAHISGWLQEFFDDRNQNPADSEIRVRSSKIWEEWVGRLRG